MLSVPNQDEREGIIKIIAPWISFSNTIARLTPGYVAADLQFLCQNVILNMSQRGSCHTMVFLFIIMLIPICILKINLLII